MNKIKENIKWIALLVCIVVLAVFVLAANTNGFTDFNPYGWFGDNKGETEAEQGNDEDVSENMGFEVHNSSLMRLSVARAASDTPSLTSVSSGVTLTATIMPSNAVDKTVDWKVEFVDSSSTWAKGKTASNYVTVTPTSDGATTAAVSAKNAFGAQIKITVTSRGNSDATAYCLVDYGQRLVSNATMTFEDTNVASSGELSTSGVNTVEAIRPLNWQVMAQAYAKGFLFVPDFGTDYTKAVDSVSVTYSVKPSDSLYAALRTNGIAKSTNDWVSFDEAASQGKIYESMCTVQLIPLNGTSSEPQNNVVKFNNSILAASGTYDFQIKITVTTDYETKDYIFPCLVNRNGKAFQASNVSLNSTSIVL